METHDHLADGVKRGYWTDDKASPLQQLAKRAIGAATGLLRYLDTTEAPQRWKKLRRRR